MDSLRITTLLLLSVAGISCGALDVLSEKSTYSTNDDHELRDRIIGLESAITEMSSAKLALDDKMDMLVREIKQLKEKSESRIHALKEELATTNQHLSKAIKVIMDIESNMHSNGTHDWTRQSIKTGASVPSNSNSVHKIDRRLLIPGATTATTINGVAFSATMINHQENLGINQIVRFDHVITNIGSGFDPVTSVFKSPVSGLYFFTVVIMSHATEDIETQMVKNGIALVNTYSGDSTTWNQGSQSTVVHLNAGDDVYVHIQNNKGVNDGNVRVFGGSWSSFSGFLISQ